jgi:hypothetical protein
VLNAGSLCSAVAMPESCIVCVCVFFFFFLIMSWEESACSLCECVCVSMFTMRENLCNSIQVFMISII